MLCLLRRHLHATLILPCFSPCPGHPAYIVFKKELKIIVNGLFQFQKIYDLKLLGSNIELIKSLNLPLCRVLKLQEQLCKLNKGKEEI